METGMVWRWRHLLAVLILIGLVVPRAMYAAPAEIWHYTVVTTDPPNPGPGWGTVAQLLTRSGCNGTSCGSSWKPRNAEYEVLLEKSSDRVPRGHGQGDGTPPYTAAVVYRRQACPTDAADNQGRLGTGYFLDLPPGQILRTVGPGPRWRFLARV